MGLKVDLSEIMLAVKELDEVSDKIFPEKVLQNAMKAAVKPMLDQARFDAPEHSGNLKRNIQARSASIRNPMTTAAAIRFGIFANHAHLVQFGTKPRYKKKNGQYVGIMPPNLFFKIAYEQHKGAAIATLDKHVREATTKELRKVLGD